MDPFQPSLFVPPARPVASPRASVQTKELVRVEGRIASAVLAWCRAHVGQTFHLADITSAIEAQIEVAPDSTRRVLGELRRQGHVQVDLLSRSDSLYVVRAVGEG